ncbi:MAG: hypothetical protein CVU18_17135 [Betaproteobacteria bacterium HGW-Betaproteobacteria-12]|jgi:hypothetical protein|nr:MAG: hypothetical protein CVU18_17135 [Betaproteobacteria bacterium HGW-Betaproteobacteria-12]
MSFGGFDTNVPLPVRRRASKYPRDAEAIAHAERRVAGGMSDYAAIMDAIRVVNPSPDTSEATALNRLTGQFRAKHGARKHRKPA